MTVEKRYVLITGSAGGIGRACVALFAEHGWHVIGIDLKDFGEGFPTNGIFIKADISHAGEYDAIFQKVSAATPVLARRGEQRCPPGFQTIGGNHRRGMGQGDRHQPATDVPDQQVRSSNACGSR